MYTEIAILIQYLPVQAGVYTGWCMKSEHLSRGTSHASYMVKKNKPAMLTQEEDRDSVTDEILP